jgi:hypothetical protein
MNKYYSIKTGLTGLIKTGACVKSWQHLQKMNRLQRLTGDTI